MAWCLFAVNLLNEEWCWEEKFIELEVVDQNLSAITFRQSGYILSCHLSHDITLVSAPCMLCSKPPLADLTQVCFLPWQNFAQESKPGNVGSFNLTKGINKFCLKEPGVYKLTPVSCHQFEQETYVYDTWVPQLG